MKKEKSPHVKKNRLGDPSDFQEQAIEKDTSAEIMTTRKSDNPTSGSISYQIEKRA